MAALELVVARYREDIRWLRRVPRAFAVSVYDKGGDGPGQPLPNVGREAHTYLHHIVSAYDRLADLTVFSQGKPFDHVPGLHGLLRQLAAGQDRVADFRWLGFVIDRDDDTGSRLYRTWSKNPGGTPLEMRAFWQALWPGAACPRDFVFYPGAHFAATRDLIQRRPRAFYERALDLSGTFPDAAHCYERCWDALLGVDGIPPEHRAAPMPIFFKPIRRLME